MPEVSERMAEHFTGAFVKSEFSRKLLKMIFSLGEQDVGLHFLQILDMSSRAGAEENDNVVQGFAAIMGYSSEWAKKWVLAIESFYSKRFIVFTDRPGVFGGGNNFDEACVLGLFTGANRRNGPFDEEELPFEDSFSGALAAIVFCSWGGGTKSSKSSFETNLSKQVKAYFREAGGRSLDRVRLAVVLLEKVRARMNPKIGSGRQPQNPTDFGWVILNQMAYGVFGCLGREDRLGLLRNRFADLIRKEEAKK